MALPQSTEALLKLVDSENPQRLPDPKDDERLIWIKVGRRQLIDELLVRNATPDASTLTNSTLPEK